MLFKIDRNETSQRFLIVLCTSILSTLFFTYVQAADSDKGKLLEKVIDNWIDVAQVQYDKAMYVQAEQSLDRAQEYFEYANAKQQQAINELMNQVRSATIEKQTLLEQLDQIEKMILKNQLLQAKAQLEDLKKSKLLNKVELQKVELMLNRTDARLGELKNRMAELFKQSQQYFEAGEMEKAEKGFIEVAASGLYVPSKGKTAEDYLQEIQKPASVKNSSSSETVKFERYSPGKSKLESKTKPDYLEKTSAQPNLLPPQTNRDAGQLMTEQQPANKSNIKSSYAKAVVRDAQTKVAKHLASNELGHAKAVIVDARALINKYQKELDHQLYRQLTSELDGLAAMILRQQDSTSK